VLSKLLENDKILVFYISYKIELTLATFLIWFMLFVKNMLCFSNLLLETKKQKKLLSRKNRTNRSNQNHIGLYFKSQPNQTKLHVFLFCGLDDF